MFKLKRSFIAALAVVLMLAMVGCGGPKVSPEESMKIYLNIAIKSDLSEASKIGMPDEDQKKAKEIREKNLDTAVNTVFANAETKVSDATKEKFKNTMLQLAQKIAFSTEPVSKSDKSAVVKVSITSVDQDEFVNKVFLPAIEKKASEPNFDWTTEGADVMAELYAGAVDTMPLKSEPMEFEVKCVIDAKTNCWRPEDAKAFKANITAATDGMEF